jgi:aminopeptidase N
VEVFYHGTPIQDASGWGGVYNQSGYFYNLGVGFDSDPQSFGRAWFPCFDNFVEKCTFEINITSNATKLSFSNGELVFEQPIGPALLLRKWKIDHPIPSYLACFATGPYTTFKRTIQGLNGPIPVQIAAAASDTNHVATTYKHLQNAITGFEYWYGPYRWNKIGYSLVPFNSGAMEHATNITIMKSAIDGTLTYETLWAHELSHHWWGDLATCSSSGDMWLNEGWASYSESLFTEWVYGKPAYLSAVQTNFLDVLQNIHVTEGGYRAVAGVPHDLTYGKHVYNKGAVVVHNLRTYLGDTLFRQGIQTVLAGTEYKNWSSTEFRDKLSAATGKDMTPFFDDWVLAPGFTHFSIDSFHVKPTGNQFEVTVFVHQKLRGAPHFYTQVPLECTFVSGDWTRTYRTATASGPLSTLQFVLPFAPQRVWVNTQLKLTLARSDKEQVLKTTGQASFSTAKLDMKVNVLPDSALVRVEHHFALPDTAGVNPHGYKITDRYWTIDGFFPPGFDASSNVFYDGQGHLDQLDAELFAQTGASEDSVLLLYRSGPGTPWQEYPTYVKNPIGSTVDRYGYVRIDHIQPGEYTFAKGVSTLFTNEPRPALFQATAWPNPAVQTVHIRAESAFERLEMYHTDGSLVKTWKLNRTDTAEINIAEFPSGQYWILARGPSGVGICSIFINH